MLEDDEEGSDKDEKDEEEPELRDDRLELTLEDGLTLRYLRSDADSSLSQMSSMAPGETL